MNGHEINYVSHWMNCQINVDQTSTFLVWGIISTESWDILSSSIRQTAFSRFPSSGEFAYCLLWLYWTVSICWWEIILYFLHYSGFWATTKLPEASVQPPSTNKNITACGMSACSFGLVIKFLILFSSTWRGGLRGKHVHRSS